MPLERAKSFVRQRPVLFSIAKASIRSCRNLSAVSPYAKKAVFRVTDRFSSKLMVNVGGGVFVRRGWQVLDHPSPWYKINKLFLDHDFDLTSPNPMPFDDNSVDFFFSAHTIEHIPQEFCARIFSEMHRCLKPGGAARLMTPDFDRACDAYEAGDEAYFVKYQGDTLEEKLLYYFASYWADKVPAERVREDYRSMARDDFADYYTSRIERQTQRDEVGKHVNWWTFDKLKRMLVTAGFTTVYRSAPQQSRFPEMQGVGRQTGFDSTHPEISLLVEAVK